MKRSRVPGTFKQPPPEPVRTTDFPSTEVRQWGADTEGRMIGEGALAAYTYILGECSVIVAREPVGPGGSYRWHLSIAHRGRYPTWDEIKTARYSIPVLANVRLMVQLLPKIDSDVQWMNAHDNCFHLYESTDEFDIRRT